MELVSSLPDAHVAHHDSRRVNSASHARYNLATEELLERAQTAVLFNPWHGMRTASPMNVAGFSSSGDLAWALPMSHRRLATQTAEAYEAARSQFALVWDWLAEAVASHSGGRTFDYHESYGTVNPEIQGQHPWVELASMDDMLVLGMLSSRLTRYGEEYKEWYQGWFSGTHLLLDGEPIQTKVGLKEPKNGAIELNHLVVIPEADWLSKPALVSNPVVFEPARLSALKQDLLTWAARGKQGTTVGDWWECIPDAGGARCDACRASG